jgi:hypothetical protein
MGRLVNNEFERAWKEALMALQNIHLAASRKTKKNLN